MDCQYCQKSFSTSYAMKNHQKTTKSCIKIQQKTNESVTLTSKYECIHCKKKLTTFTNLTYHLNICKSKSKPLECNACHEKDKIIAEREKTINEYASKINEVTKRYSEPIPSESKYEFLKDLVTIRNDGMVNGYELCVAGNVNIFDYMRLPETKEYFEKVSLWTGLSIPELLNAKGGGWFHRKVACHLAHWISADFGIKLADILADIEKNKIHEFYQQSQKHGLIHQNELGSSKKHNFDSSDNSNNSNNVLHKELTHTINQLTDQNHALKIIETPKQHVSKQSTNILEFTFNDTIVPIRHDGMINATALCRAGNKLIADYLRLSNTKAYLEAVESNMGIPILELIKVNTGGDHSGTWVHRKIGYHLAQWISPQFAVKVSTILDELFVTGSVVIGQEKTSQHIELMYQEKVKSLQDQIVTIEKALELTKQEHNTLIAKHNSTLKNHRYVKFKEKGPCFYIIESGISSLDGIERKKFGIAGTDHDTIDERFKSHRTLWPQLKVNYIIFMKEIEVLETSIKRLYKKEINPNGHEIIEGISTEQLIDSIDKIIIALGIDEYHVLSREKIKEYNEYVQTTLKL
jgi:hypothetical protein